MKTIFDISLSDILPPNLLLDERISAAAKAIDGELLKITNEIKKLNYISSLDELNDIMLDELAWQYHLDFYDTSLPIEKKRELIERSDAWHKRKGTPSAVEELITAVFGDGKVEEWFEFGGDPFTFRVITSNPAVTDEQAQAFIKALNSVKNVRSKLDTIQISKTDSLNFYLGGFVQIGDKLSSRQVG